MREEGDANSEQFSNIEIYRGGGLSVPNRGNERQEEECKSCPETSVGNYHFSLHNNPEERSSQLLRGGSLK